MTGLFAGILLGAAGSAHCVLMCGPFAAVVAPRGWRAVAHHAGRMAMYAVLGTAAGLLGQTAATAGAGRILAVLAAIALVAQAIHRWESRPSSAAESAAARLVRRGVGATSRIASRHPIRAAAAVGALNGLLPCGLVYGAVVASIGLGTVIDGGLFMMGFGAGTVPMLALAAGSAHSIAAYVPALKRLAPAGLLAAAVLVAIRGLAILPAQFHSH
jgi:sulfite exporter TauE/SafE